MSKKHYINVNALDTFCFYWANKHSYVLLRVLEQSIAILPIRSRLAFLYFHYNSSNYHNGTNRKQEPVGIQDMFKMWRHTLSLNEEKELPTPRQQILKIEEDQQQWEDQDENVTLENVISESIQFNGNWRHCQCQVDDGGSRFDNHIVLTTQHNHFKLTARSFTEKMIFLNLVKFKQHQQDIVTKKLTMQHYDSDDEEATGIPSDTVLKDMQKHNTLHLEQIQYHIERLERAKQSLQDYKSNLLILDQSLDVLIENAFSVGVFSKNTLGTIEKELNKSVLKFHDHRERVSILVKSGHKDDFLDEARRKYELVKKRLKSHAWYPTRFPLLAVAVIGLVIGMIYVIFNKRLFVRGLPADLLY